MGRYQAALQERADLVAANRVILAKAEEEGRAPTAEENVQLDANKTKALALNAEIERLEAQRELERNVSAVSTVAVAGGASLAGARPRSEDDPNAGFRNTADFAVAVHQASRPGARMDERLAALYAAPSNFHQETGGTSGEGFLVPTAFRDTIWGLVNEGDDLLNMVNVEPTNSNSVGLLADETTPWGATGIVARWRAEATQMTPSKLDLDARQVRLHELYAFVIATEELLQDAPRLESRITQRAAEAIRYKASDAIMWGTGAGQPLGIMNAGSLVTQTKETGQAAATLTAANVAKLFSRIIGAGRSVFLMNQDVFPQLATMTLGDQPIWTPPASGIVNAPGGFLFGRPIRFSEHSETLGTLGDVVLFNPDGYYATQRTGGPQFASSMHLYFDYNMQAFRWTFRLGGMPLLSAAVSPDRGSTTKSHFVALQSRT